MIPGAEAANPYSAGLSAVSGLAAGGPSSAETGDTSIRTRTGGNTFNFGGNPNATTARTGIAAGAVVSVMAITLLLAFKK